jgi:hypothetical protein
MMPVFAAATDISFLQFKTYSLSTVFLFFSFNMYLPLKEFLTNKHGWQLSIPIGLSTLVFVAALFVFMMIHELIHALLIPNILKSEKT